MTMTQTAIGNLRRARNRANMRITQHKRLLDGYRAHLAAIKADIHTFDPQLKLPHAHHRRNTVFLRGELTRFSMEIMRGSDEPLSVRVLAVRVLAMKGHEMPGPRLRRIVQHRIREMFAALDGRGVTVRVEGGKEIVRRIA